MVHVGVEVQLVAELHHVHGHAVQHPEKEFVVRSRHRELHKLTSMRWIAMFVASIGEAKMLKDKLTLSMCRVLTTGRFTPFFMSYGRARGVIKAQEKI